MVKKSPVMNLASEETVIVVLLVVLVVLVVYYIWQNNREGFDDESNVLYFFYVEWCPHCQNAKPVIAELENDLGDRKVRVQKVDCDKNKELARNFGVQAYPTLVLVKGEERVEYESGVSLEGLKDFLDSNL